MENIIDEIIKDTCHTHEAILFKEALIINSKQLNRTLNEVQIKAAWARWKRERMLDDTVEPNVNTKNLFTGDKRFRLIPK